VARSGARERGLPLHVVGVSLGGGILLGALPDLDPHPASVTLAVTPLRIAFSGRAVANELGFPLLRTLWREREHYGLHGLIPSFGPFKRGAYPLRLGVPPGPGAFGYVPVLNAALESLHLEDAARRVESPVLLVYGRRDRLVPGEQGEQLARLLPLSEMLSLPGESHLSAPLAPPAVERMLEWIEENG
jgi:pimeloyl-ACP methyl ester carboxylesterase